MAASTDQHASLRPLSRGTANLIRSRCEREVRGGILRWSGLPIGGTGALAFLATLLVWIPQQIQNADLGEVGQDIVRAYVGAAVIRNSELKTQLDEMVRAAVSDNAGREVATQIQALSSTRVEQALAAAVQDAVAQDAARILRSPAMEAQVTATVAAALQPDNYRPLRDAIVTSMRQRLSESVAENAEQAIQTVANPLPEDQIIDKSTSGRLRQYVRELESRPLPEGYFALRKYVAAGSGEDHGYDPNVVMDYLRELRRVIGDQFRYVLILDRQHRFVALSTVDEFERALQEDPYGLEGILNNGNLSLAEAKRALQELLGPHSLLALDQTVTIKAALQSEALQGPDREVAVVENGEGARLFKGVTDRKRLIEALLP